MHAFRSTLVYSLAFFMIAAFQPCDLAAQGRNFYGFKNIVHGHAKINLVKQIDYAPDDYYADLKGGYIEIFVAKGQCSDKYRFSWTFEEDMSKLEPGKVYAAELKAERLDGSCKQNEAWMQLQGSNEKCQLCTDRNLTKSTVSIAAKAKGDERVYAVPESYPKTTKYEVSVSRVAEEETMIFLSFGCKTNPSPHQAFDYQVVYHYKKNYQPETGSIGFDCQMLYGIGTNMAFLETGAQNGDDWETLQPYLDGALKYLRASNCLESDYLLDLKDRMKDTEDASAFAAEIQKYREQIPNLVAAGCLD